MSKFDDFDLDVVKVSKQDSKITPQWKSESLCTLIGV
nr:gallidermin/nisin family lantibiotic [Bacillus subtilis]